MDEALQAYREKTGDMRPFEALPVAVTSQILRAAQQLKGHRRGRILQPVIVDEAAEREG